MATKITPRMRLMLEQLSVPGWYLRVYHGHGSFAPRWAELSSNREGEIRSAGVGRQNLATVDALFKRQLVFQHLAERVADSSVFAGVQRGFSTFFINAAGRTAIAEDKRGHTEGCVHCHPEAREKRKAK